MEKLRRAEETGAGSTANLLCCAELRIRVWDVERAGESSPASTERSEVNGPRDSPRIAEGRMGSYKEHQL